MKHRWNPPTRPDLNNTYRSCAKCGLIKITRHEHQNNPPNWTEFEIDGRKIEAAKTPECAA